MKNYNYYFRYVCYNTFLRQNKQICLKFTNFIRFLCFESKLKQIVLSKRSPLLTLDIVLKVSKEQTTKCLPFKWSRFVQRPS